MKRTMENTHTRIQLRALCIQRIKTKRPLSVQQVKHEIDNVKLDLNRHISNLRYGIGNVYTMPHISGTDIVINLNT
jgi:hypothetical protein